MILLFISAISLIVSCAVLYRIEKLHREIQGRLKAYDERQKEYDEWQKESEAFIPAFRKEDIERAVSDDSVTPLFL